MTDARDAMLVERFGIGAFRPWQREAVDAILDQPQPRVLLVAPTGGGKSLCYQFPAVALGGTTLVLSPLISLMQDQVRALEARGVRATFVASAVPREENARRVAGLRKGEYQIVYAAPERLVSDAFVSALVAAKLALVAVDEAHCIVQWGHDFRPDYLRIGELLRRLEPARVLACTATATAAVRAEIMNQLGFPPAETTVILRGFARPNLHLAVEAVSGPREGLSRTTGALLAELGSAKKPAGGAIVYAATRKRAEEIADGLRDARFDARAYHAGMDADDRTKIADAFAARTLHVVVATNAFGMGIDRPDVRVVVHAQPPSSIEAYYQEVGRAGRDGALARGLLLHAPTDIAVRRRLCLGDGSDKETAEGARSWALFRELLRYVDASTCRHDFILRYFGDEAEAIGGCGHCDVCLSEGATPDGEERTKADLDVVRRALAGVARAQARVGMQAVAAMLVGESTERVTKSGLDRLSTFGVLKGRSSDDVMTVLRVLLANGWTDLTPGDYPMPVVTKAGWAVMKGDVAPRVRLPEAEGARPTRRAIRPKPRKSAKGDGAGLDERAAEAMSADVDTDLLAALRAERLRLAKEASVPAYVVAPNRTLDEMATLRPRSTDDLAMVHGMGPTRIAAYGDALLAIVRGSAR
ncbi:MAG TPA: ATP-dependent DNA helicase RecQ [Byssovorax sp.]